MRGYYGPWYGEHSYNFTKLLPGQKIRMYTVYHSPSYLSLHGLTAADIARFEGEEHGNTDIRAQMESCGDVDLARILANDCIWVCLNQYEAKRYNRPNHVEKYIVSGTVLASDGEGGYLVHVERYHHDYSDNR